jgi:hypothetical protein
MKARTQHTNTWTHISLAARRVLGEVETTKEKAAGERQETNRKQGEAEQDAERPKRSSVPLANKKLVR